MKEKVIRITTSRKVRYIGVITTLPDRRTASRIAGTLIEERLAACVQMWPIVSAYRWKGRLCRSAEYILLAKAPSACVNRLAEGILKCHPYKVPEVVFVPFLGGYRPYLEWLDSETERTPPEQ